MIILNLKQNSEEWFQERKGTISSSRVKNVLTGKVINKTDAVNHLLEEQKKALLEQLETEEIDEKEFKKLLAAAKKEISAKSQRELESMIPEEMYEAAFTESQKKEYYRLLAEKLGYSDDLEEDPRDRGHRLEPEAAEKISEKTGLKLIEVGFCKREDYEGIALSPDRFVVENTAVIEVDDDGIVTNTDVLRFLGGVEIKSPGVVNHLEIWKTNKVPAEYWWQVIQYFVVADVDYVIFASYNPLVKEYPLHLIKINKEDVLADITESFDNQVNVIKHLEKDVLSLTF